MAFTSFTEQQQGIHLLQRSLERGRLAHGYLFAGDQLERLEALARTLAKTLNCLNPVRVGAAGVDCCDQCLACRKIDHGNHADVHWARAESKSRVITIDQMRDLMREIQLKPTEATHKVAVIVAADRLKQEGANAFLKTLEEPPPNSVLILLTTEPQRLLDTIVSRCLRITFGGEGHRPLDPDLAGWLAGFSEMAAGEQKSLLGRYHLMDVLLRKLNHAKAVIEENLTAKSPLQQYKEAEKSLTDKWEDELAAAIEAEYRRQRSDLLGLLHWWLRDVWIQTLGGGAKNETPALGTGLLRFPQLEGTGRVARRITPADAAENLDVLEGLQRWLGTNVQEALALEVGLLKLRL